MGKGELDAVCVKSLDWEPVGKLGLQYVKHVICGAPRSLLERSAARLL